MTCRFTGSHAHLGSITKTVIPRYKPLMMHGLNKLLATLESRECGTKAGSGGAYRLRRTVAVSLCDARDSQNLQPACLRRSEWVERLASAAMTNGTAPSRFSASVFVVPRLIFHRRFKDPGSTRSIEPEQNSARRARGMAFSIDRVLDG
jgi:hypothetical protein